MAYRIRKASLSSWLELAGKSDSRTSQACRDASGCIITPARSIPPIRNMLMITTLAAETGIEALLAATPIAMQYIQR